MFLLSILELLIYQILTCFLLSSNEVCEVFGN